MAATTKQAPTTLDGLKSVAGEIFNLTMSPDSTPHMQFLQSLVQGIQQYIVKNAMQAVNKPMGAGPGGGAPPGGPQGPGPQGIGQTPPPTGAGNPMMSPPNAGNINPDELRRVLGAGAPVA